MHFDVEREVQLGRAAQALAQDFFLDLELVLVARVLVVASTAAGVVLAAGLDAMREGSVMESALARAKPGFCSVREASIFSWARTKGMNTALPRPWASSVLGAAGRRARPSPP